MLYRNQICFIAIKNLLLQSKTFYCAELVCYCNERLFIAIKYCLLQKKKLLQSSICYHNQHLLLKPTIFYRIYFVLLQSMIFYCNQLIAIKFCYWILRFLSQSVLSYWKQICFIAIRFVDLTINYLSLQSKICLLQTKMFYCNQRLFFAINVFYCNRICFTAINTCYCKQGIFIAINYFFIVIRYVVL